MRRNSKFDDVIVERNSECADCGMKKDGAKMP